MKHTNRVWVLLLTLFFLASLVEAQDKGKKPPPVKKHEFDWSKMALKLRDGKFAFHLLDVDGKEGSSKDYFGKPLIVLVASTGDDVCGVASANLEEAAKDFPGVEFITIYNVPDLPPATNVPLIREHMEKAKAKDHRSFLAYNQVFNQLEVGMVTPWILYINRDGSVERNVIGWMEGKREEGKDYTSTPLMTRELLPTMLAKAKPNGPAPSPPPLEKAGGPEPYKDEPRESPPGSGE